MKPTLLSGDCLERLRAMASDQIDSLVTDPPAGISFMGKHWDGDKGGRKEWIDWMTSVMAECLRVMKPGAHGLVWALPRTSHWTATALEDAGFEVRDVITHLFGTGFPKSLDVSKAIDKAAGAERKDLGPNPHKLGRTKDMRGGRLVGNGEANMESVCRVTAPTTAAAKQWQGWGTALKPASEHWILVRKPLSEKTVAANVLKWGTGAINVDASRIGTDSTRRPVGRKMGGGEYGGRSLDRESVGQIGGSDSGRFPANLTLDEYAAGLLDEQSLAGGMHSAGKARKGSGNPRPAPYNATSYAIEKNTGDMHRFGDSGGASRFFYVAKASKSDKNAGLEGMPETECGIGDDRPSGQSMSRLDGREPRKAQNTHPTVKSTTLMTYLIRMVTPPNGTVLDPFMGSGSTGVAARELSMQFVGIEQDPDYLKIAKARILKP